MEPEEKKTYNNPFRIREINYAVNDSFKQPRIETKQDTKKLEEDAEQLKNDVDAIEELTQNFKDLQIQNNMRDLALLNSKRFATDANFLLNNTDKVIFRSDDGHTVFVPEYKAKMYSAQNPTATQIPDTKKYVNDALETLYKQYTQEQYLYNKPEYAKQLDDLYKTFTPQTKGKARAEAVNNLFEDIYGEEVGQGIENQITLIDESIAKYREKLEDDYVDDIKTGKTTALSRFLGSYKSSELRNLNLAEDLIGRIKDELRARKNQSGFWRGIIDTDWSNVLTFEIESIVNAATKRNLFERIDKYGIDNLRDDEKLLLDALVAGEAIKNYPKELTTLYNVGASIVPSISFMASYGASKALLKGVKTGVKKVAEKALKKYIKDRAKELGVKTATETAGKAAAETAKKTLTQKAKDLAVRTGKELATSAGQVPLMPTYWANRIERNNGDIQIETNGFGENTTYNYKGRKISDTPEYDAYMSTLIDIASEKAGALIPFGRFNFGKYFGKAIPGDSKFWQNTRKFISGVGGDRLKRAVDFNGFIGEYSEELIAGTLNSMLVGDQKIEDVFAKQNMIETALSVGVISLGMGLVSGGLSIPASKKVKKEFLAAEEELKKVIPSPREREKFIREVATAGYEQQAAVMNKFVQAAENARKSGDMESSATYIEAANIIGRYMNAYNRYQTYNSYLDEQIKEKLETEKSAIQEATNPDMDNNIVVADYYGKNVKVVAGKVEFNEDGTVNTENSSESIVILNDDGSKQQVSPQGLTLKDMYESSELEAKAEARIRNEVQMQSDAATAEGKREYLTDEQAAYIRELGIHGIEVDDELDAYYTEDPELNLVVAEARQRYPGTPDIGQQAQSASEQKQMQAQYPRDAKGNPDFAQITPEQAAQILTTEYPEDYAEFVQNKVAAAEKRIEKASKAKPQSTDLSDIKAEREAIRAEQTAAQQEYDYWNNVKTLLNRQDVNTTEQITEEQPADANLSVAENETLQPRQTVEETTAAKQEEQQQYPTDESEEPVSSETLAKDRAELEEIFGKSFFPNVFETVKKRTAERMAEVSKAAKEFKAELKNAPEIILISDINDIPKYDTQVKTIYDVYRRMTVNGWYSPGNGKIYVNLASHLTPEDVKATILHEAVGHSGLRRLLGKDAFDRLCNTVYQSLPEDKQKKMLEATRKIHPNATDEQLHLIVGDEYMATLAEGGAEQSIPQRIISAVRDFLRSIGIDLEINEADLRYLLHASYKNIKDADAVTVVNNSALLARLRKAAEETHIKSEAESVFRLGKKSRDAYERLLAEKRPDMPENMRKEALDYLDSLEDTKANTKKIKIAVKWLADGTIRLPEDADKVDTAIEYANRKGIDAMQYNSPLDLIDALKGHVEIKDKPIDPDAVKELSNKVDYGDGLTVYDVEDSEAGRQAMRKIINTHFGKDASPWCLLQGDSEGNLTSQSAQYWQHYNAYPKRVAFKDGKLLAFFANDEDTPVWWDRLDIPNYNGIPVTGKIKGDPLGRSGTRIFNERTKTFGKPLDIHKGNKQNGTYEAWHYNGQMRVRAHYKNGIPVGNYESWYENGNPLVKTSYNEKGEYDGLYESWHDNGQQSIKTTYKDGLIDGLYESWYINGLLEIKTTYKNGRTDGLSEEWYENGQRKSKVNYKNGKRDGLSESWHENGQRKSRANYKDEKNDGLSESWHENGQRKLKVNYKNDKREGLFETWYKNGRPEIISNYKDGRKDGLYEIWYNNGYIYTRTNYNNGKKEGLYEVWDTQGNLIQKSYYENDVLKEVLPLDDSAEEVRFRKNSDFEAEEQAIINRAKSDDTYMKAPNGEPTKLTPKQWVQVRTKAFKEWFGDWEKAARIEKLRKSKPLVVSGNDYQGKYELNPKSATRYVLDNLRGNYVNLDTGETIRISRKGAEKVMKHDAESEAHLKSAAYIPQMIGNAVFITEEANTKEKTGFDSYRYYVLGLRMGSVDYTAKLVVGVKDGEAYYDHALTEIEKNSLLESIDPINTGFANKEDAVSAVKDKRLLSLLQTNSSKVVDENGEPRVIDGLYLNIKERNPITRLDISINKANNYVNKISEIENETGMEWDNESIFYQEEKAYNLLESIVSQKDYIEILINSIRKGIIPSIVVAYRYGDINERGRSYNYRDQIFEQGISVVGRVSELNTNIDKYYELFYGEQPYNIVVGVYSGNRGADGEILLTPATKLGLVENLGNIIKSATDNTGSFSSENADIRFRLDTPEEQQVSMASEASDRTYTETDKAPEIDYDMPATDVIEQISAKSSVEPLFRQGAFDKDFAAIVALQDAIKQTSLYQQNASSKELTNRLNVGLYDAMAPLKDFISQIEESRGQKIDDDHNPYYLENASASKAQERIESLKRDNIKPLAETTNDAAQLLQGREMLKLYLMGKTGLERQKVKEASQQNEGFYDFAGLTGLQRMLIIQQIGEANITDEVITTLNGLDYPQLLDYANEHNYQTTDKYVETCDKKLGDTGITLWEQIRDLSKKQLRGQYDAGLISRDAYYYLTTGIRISDLLAANRDNGIISDKKYNNISDTDMDVSELRDKGYITQQQYDMLNTYKPLYLYYLPLKGDASITASDINDYESTEQKNKSKISKVKGHENLTRDPLTQLVSDCYGAIQNEEHNRWLREVLRAARLSNLSDNVVKITPLNVGATRVATEGETAAKQGKKRNERLIADVKATNKQVDEHSVIVFDGGRAYKMTFADLSLAKALRTSGGRFADASAFVNWASRKTRAWAMMLTTLNPMFVASNTFRDVGEALFVNYVNLGAKAIPVFVRAWNPANKLQQALHRHLKGKPGNTPYDALVKEYFDNGGPTSYSMMPDFDKIKSDMDKMVRDSKRGNYNPVKMGKTVLDWLEVQAKHSELLSRVATYAMYRGTLPEYNIGKNASITEAIWQSKEVTVNFDKRGAWAKELGVTALFWNAGRQSNRIHYNLLKNHPVRYLAATAAMSSIKVALPGLLSTLVSYLYGDDEKGKEYLDKYYAINRYTRFNNLCLLWGDAIVKIPISPSFGPTAIMSEIVSEMIYTDFDKDRALSMTADLAQSMATLVGNDIFGSVVGAIAKGEPKELIGAIPFAIAQPFAELLANRNWQGRQIMRDYQGLDYLPAYYKAYGNVEDYYIESAKWINKITGGDEGKPGKLNKLIGNPAANKHIIESYLGGLGSFIFDSLNTGANIVNGRWDRVIAESPFKRFLGDPEVYQDQEAWEDYYSVKSKINELSTRITSYKQSGNERKAYKLEDVRDELKYLLKPYDDYIDASKEDMQEALNRNPKDAREVRRKHRRDMAKYLKTLKKQIEHIDTDL